MLYCMLYFKKTKCTFVIGDSLMIIYTLKQNTNLEYTVSGNVQQTSTIHDTIFFEVVNNLDQIMIIFLDM